ncbi:MAG: diiron oxygenase [Acidimicrobiia bacterium]
MTATLPTPIPVRPTPGPDATDPAVTTSADGKVTRLSNASSRRTIEPDTYLPWGTLGSGQVIPDELLTLDGLVVDGRPVTLTTEQKARLSREEVAAMLTMGVHFEAVLTAGFARQVAEAPDLSDPRVTYMLHEIGEEARHSRAFIRLIDELGPTAKNPIDTPFTNWALNRLTRSLAKTEALLFVMVLAGEEIPDLLQKLAADHPGTDPLLAALNRYHRMEEARHLSFARTVLPEAWARVGWIERQRVRFAAPLMIDQLWQAFVHPGVYATVGLPTWKTWKAVAQLPRRIELRKLATRPVLETLLEAGVIRRGRVPRGWRKLCGVDRHGAPVD